MSGSPTFTVFTPTYDRAHTLHRVFASLCAQTMRDFEWLVVDDGSSDGTAELVARWAGEAPFPVRYVHQENAGKHVAINHGVREARGELFLGLDSDDECVSDALERLLVRWHEIPETERSGFVGVSGLCVNPEGGVLGSRFPADPTDSDPLELRHRFRVTGEKWGFSRTDVLREHPFPDLAGQPFVTESMVWNRIAASYRTRYVNDVLRIYHDDGSGDSLSEAAQHAVARAPMFAMKERLVLDEQLEWFRYHPMGFVRSAANYVRFSWHDGVGVVAQSSRLRSPTAKLLHVLAVPLGALVYARDLHTT